MNGPSKGRPSRTSASTSRTRAAVSMVKYSSGSIYSSISAIEEARRKILKNMNISYALKEMIIKIGG